MPRRATRATQSTGNVFRDVGFSAGQAEHLRVRADLIIKIEKVLRSRGLTQREAASVMGVSQPRVSDLMRGKIDAFSSDALIDMLGRLGLRVRLVASASGSRRVA